MKKKSSNSSVGQALCLSCSWIGRRYACLTILLLGFALCANAVEPATAVRIDVAKAQVPTWSKQDLDFFLHGSMSTEVFPKRCCTRLSKHIPIYSRPAIFRHLGLIPDPEFGWPIGFSRANVKHLGGLSSMGINCASCHVAQIASTIEQRTNPHSRRDEPFRRGSILRLSAGRDIQDRRSGEHEKISGRVSEGESEIIRNAWQKQQENEFCAAMKERSIRRERC